MRGAGDDRFTGKLGAMQEKQQADQKGEQRGRSLQQEQESAPVKAVG